MCKCLYCYKELEEGQKYFHPGCAWKFFGTKDVLCQSINMKNSTIQRSASDYGENFQQFEAKISQDEFLQQVGAASFIVELADEEYGLDRIEEYTKDLRVLYNAIAKAADDEIVIADGDVYVETVKEKTMQYSYDTKNYVVGLINNNEY